MKDVTHLQSQSHYLLYWSKEKVLQCSEFRNNVANANLAHIFRLHYWSGKDELINQTPIKTFVLYFLSFISSCFQIQSLEEIHFNFKLDFSRFLSLVTSHSQKHYLITRDKITSIIILILFCSHVYIRMVVCLYVCLTQCIYRKCVRRC